MRAGFARRRGFTLIEALAAFAILALALGQLLRSVGAGAANEQRADYLLRAVADGGSHLARLGVSLPLMEGETIGRYDDGLPWRLNVIRDQAVASGGASAPVVAYRLRLEVGSGAGPGRRLILVAERLTVSEGESAVK